MANLANGRLFAKIFPANIYKCDEIQETMINGGTKRLREENEGEGKPKGLPEPNGDLSKVVPSSSIEVTNTVVRQALEKERGPRGPYISVTPAQKYAIGQRAAENQWSHCNASLLF